MEDKIKKIEEILDIEDGVIKADTVLSELDEWDSITRLSLLIFFEENGINGITGTDIKQFETVQDILDVMS